MKEIRKNLALLGSLGVKVGIVEGSGSAPNGTSVAEYAAYNEYGVPGKKKKWDIPPRPFIRGFVEDRASEIKSKQEQLVKRVADGKMGAEEAIAKLGQFAQDGIKRYIMNGNFVPNSDVTINGTKPGKNGKQFIKGKKSSRPLIDTGTMRNSVRYKIVRGGA